MEETTIKPGAAIQEDDLSVDYANNVQIEATIWDLKVIFGEFSGRAQAVQWHTSITMPWATAKLLAHFLQVNVELHELDNGKVKIPASALPEVPLQEDADPQLKAFFDSVRARRLKLIE